MRRRKSSYLSTPGNRCFRGGWWSARVNVPGALAKQRCGIGIFRSDWARHRLRNFFHNIAFSRGQEEVLFDAVLFGIEVEVAATQLEQRLMRAALDDAAALDHQDLVGTANGGQAVGDDERRSSLHQVG